MFVFLNSSFKDKTRYNALWANFKAINRQQTDYFGREDGVKVIN